MTRATKLERKKYKIMLLALITFNVTVFGIISGSLSLFFMQFECVCITISKLTHSALSNFWGTGRFTSVQSIHSYSHISNINLQE